MCNVQCAMATRSLTVSEQQRSVRRESKEENREEQKAGRRAQCAEGRMVRLKYTNSVVVTAKTVERATSVEV